MNVIDKNLLDDVSAQAKASPRLRMNRRQAERRYKLVCSLPRREGGKARLNFNFHQSLDEKCHNYGSGFMVQGSWFRVHGSWFMATYGSLLMVHGEGLMVHGS